jgi:integrase
VNGPWRDLLASFLSLRRSLGYEMKKHERLVGQFLDWLADTRPGGDRFAVADAAEWACLPGGRPGWHAERLGCVRVWAAYAHAHDPSVPLIPADLMPRGPSRRVPYIYTGGQVAAIMDVFAEAEKTCRMRTSRWKGTTHRAMTGLLACTGMRVSEAIALKEPDIDWDAKSIKVVSAKSGRERLVFLHETAAAEIAAHLAHPNRPDRAGPDGPRVFVSSTGAKTDYTDFNHDFNRAAARAGVRSRGLARPRIHDLRFTFAVNQMTAAYRDGSDPARRLTLLSTWLGHITPENTYWYLEAPQELLGAAAGLLEHGPEGAAS